jgi:hypothetical protein
LNLPEMTSTKASKRRTRLGRLPKPQLRLFAGRLLLVLSASAVLAQSIPPIGIIDFYGLRAISEKQARQALHIEEGDTMPDDTEAAERRLEALPGVAEARLNRTCCEAGKSLLYVGIRQKGTPALKFLPAPHGASRLPGEIWRAGEAFQKSLNEGGLKGDVTEDDSQGHALAHYPPVRAVQERFIVFANRDFKRLRDVLHHSSDPGHRALAAQVIAYARDKQAAATELAEAVNDSNDGVRNNAIRALLVMATSNLFHPQKPIRIRIHPGPFIRLLNSLEWTDRNKAAAALNMLTLRRDPATLASIKKTALPALVEMARWKSPNDAQPAFTVLGRIGGLSEDTIAQAWERRDVRRVIEAARRPTNTKR